MDRLRRLLRAAQDGGVPLWVILLLLGGAGAAGGHGSGGGVRSQSRGGEGEKHAFPDRKLQ